MDTPVPSMVELRGPEQGVKICNRCGDRLPATRFYFHADKDAPDGFYPLCKECRKKERQEIENRQIASTLAGSEQKLVQMLNKGEFNQILCDVVSGAETVLRAFGGIDGLAQKLAMDYEAAPLGTPVRAKLLLGVLGFVAKGMEAQEPVNLQVMSDEELHKKLNEVLSGGHGRGLADQSEDCSTVGDSE